MLLSRLDGLADSPRPILGFFDDNAVLTGIAGIAGHTTHHVLAHQSVGVTCGRSPGLESKVLGHRPTVESFVESRKRSVLVSYGWQRHGSDLLSVLDTGSLVIVFHVTSIVRSDGPRLLACQSDTCDGI